MSKDPKFSEKVLLDALDNISTPRCAHNLQAGAQLSILDAFDRGIERGAFIDILKEAMMLHTYTARLSMVAHLKAVCEATGHGIDKDQFEQAMHEVTAECETHRSALIKHVELLVQCPIEDDTLH
jgi:hypothetical protein